MLSTTEIVKYSGITGICIGLDIHTMELISIVDKLKELAGKNVLRNLSNSYNLEKQYVDNVRQNRIERFTR